MNEIDIPCSDCGTELVERTVHVRGLSVSTTWRGRVQVAECPFCGARYYPEETLIQLNQPSNDPRPGGTAER